jgi:hypothetical protein
MLQIHLYVAHSPLRRSLGKVMYPELKSDITGGIARVKPIHLDLLARDAICATEAHCSNTRTFDQTTEFVVISTETPRLC